jgi:hypothetical protein
MSNNLINQQCFYINNRGAVLIFIICRHTHALSRERYTKKREKLKNELR